MKILILVAVILQLAITIVEIHGEFQFGDMISFKRKCPCLGFTYKHFAIYVGNIKLTGKESGQDIFHRTGKILGKTDCKFGVLKDVEGKDVEGKGTKDNYLDKYFVRETKDKEDVKITHRIEEKHGNCGAYSVSTNNCEHLATYVRYGETVSLQPGTSAQRFCREPAGCPELKELVKKMVENAELEEKCMDKCPNAR